MNCATATAGLGLERAPDFDPKRKWSKQSIEKYLTKVDSTLPLEAPEIETYDMNGRLYGYLTRGQYLLNVTCARTASSNMPQERVPFLIKLIAPNIQVVLSGREGKRTSRPIVKMSQFPSIHFILIE